MAGDQSRGLVLNHAENGVDLEIGPIESIAFVVEGQNYLLVNYRDWLRRQATRSRAWHSDHPVVGRIMFNGERHVVIERPRPPCAEADLSKLELGDVLTRRELQVALLVSEGKCDKEIARALGISGYTVREHIRRTFAKLNVSRRAAIVAYVLQHLRGPIEALAELES